jgi:hypothetical protein
MASLSPKHLDFIRLIANGTLQTDAYKATVGNKSATNAQVKSKASNLAKKYAVLIDEERQRVRKVIEAANDSKVAEIAQKRIMSSAERMQWLTMMADGTIKAKRPFVVAGKIMEYPEEPSHSDRIKALAELNKMDGSYAPTKTDIQIKEIQTFRIGDQVINFGE